MVVPGSLCTGSASILPLGFGRQAVVSARLTLIELLQKYECVVPRNLFYRLVGMALEFAWIVTHHNFPLSLCNRVLPQIKRLTNGDTVGGQFGANRFFI